MRMTARINNKETTPTMIQYVSIPTTAAKTAHGPNNNIIPSNSAFTLSTIGLLGEKIKTIGSIILHSKKIRNILLSSMIGFGLGHLINKHYKLDFDAASIGIIMGAIVGFFVLKDTTTSPANSINDPVANQIAEEKGIAPSEVTGQMIVEWKRNQDNWDGVPVLPPYEAYKRAGLGKSLYAKG